MATPQFAVLPSDDDAKELPGDSSSTTHNSLAARSVIDRVATPLGLFVRPSTSDQLAMKGLGIGMPNTITPESVPSGSPDVTSEDDGSNPANDQHQRSTNGETSPESEGMRVRRLSQILGHRVESKLLATEPTTETPAEPSGNKTSTFDLTEEPLHTGVVRSNTKIVHPKPINRPTPETNSRPGTAVSNNIAQLEATAVRLSMTSSIDDAIRDLHGELKRSDSRRSSALGASIKDEPQGNTGQLMRHLSTSSSIVSTNIAARHGGYSPAGFVMSPNHSIAGRLRSGSNPSAPLLDPEPPTLLSRHGPGKSSVRSVRSVKPSLAEISETEPIALTQDVLDAADAAPPIQEQNDLQDATTLLQRDYTTTPSTDAFHKMLDEGFGLGESGQFDVNTARKNDDKPERGEDMPRPSSTHSNDTFSQAKDAFADFDGAYYHDEQGTHGGFVDEADEEEHTPRQEIQEGQVYVNSEALQALEAQPRPVPVTRARPQSYMDPETGMQMLYYPARVPAMLNLPPKLSNKPKAAERNHRQSKVLSAMWDNPVPSSSHEDGLRRHSAMPKLSASPSKPVRHSFLPEIRSDHRHSFMGLPTDETSPDLHQSPVLDEHIGQQEHDFAPAPEVLRVPKRLSRMDMGDNRMSRASMNVLPSALRASAYFDLPSTSPEIEVKDGSAMATLDSILDASAVAPVSAFTDHAFAGKLGKEVYGKEKKRKSVAASAILTPPAEDSTTEKRRSSFLWSAKRKSNMSLDAVEAIKSRTPETKSLLDPADDLDDDENVERDAHGGRIGRLKGDDADDEDNIIRVGAGTLAHRDDHEEEEEDEEEEEEGDEEYLGAPTTLLAELQLRKQQQQERTKNRLSQAPLGTRATLLEMDAIAESQRQDRKAKRVNLAWEDPDAHYDQNGSDDEDVPLAIIAAKHAGAKNMADVERPMGLMEKRDMEDNEPLSQRRARLQGRDALTLPRPPTIMSMGPSRLGDSRLPHSVMPPTPEPVEEIEGETLAERRRRLAGRDGSEISLPKSRPVSRAFSEELLSQFGDFSKDEQPDGAKEGGNAEETLGQRRRRLQAERTAREQEMSYGNTAQARKLGMADVLGAHARKSPDLRVQEARLRREEQDRVEREREAKMAAMRMQMPTTLSTPFSGRQSQYNGNVMHPNGGLLHQQRPSMTHMPQHMVYQNMNQQSMYGNMGQQQVYNNNNMNGNFGQMNGYGSTNNINMYNNPGAVNVYGNGTMQMPMATGSMDRVELWRQGVRP